MSYRHVQRGRIHLMLMVFGLALAVGSGLTVKSNPAAAGFLLVGAILFGLLTFMFTHLLIEDRGDHLFVQFGPLGLFSRSVSYSSIRSVKRTSSTLIDGIGIHWVPGRGWIWNIQMGECVELLLDKGTLRLGTDDADGLGRFLEEKISG